MKWSIPPFVSDRMEIVSSLGFDDIFQDLSCRLNVNGGLCQRGKSPHRMRNPLGPDIRIDLRSEKKKPPHYLKGCSQFCFLLWGWLPWSQCPVPGMSAMSPHSKAGIGSRPQKLGISCVETVAHHDLFFALRRGELKYGSNQHCRHSLSRDETEYHRSVKISIFLNLFLNSSIFS